jgi:hypothetical protein
MEGNGGSQRDSLERLAYLDISILRGKDVGHDCENKRGDCLVRASSARQAGGGRKRLAFAEGGWGKTQGKSEKIWHFCPF